MTTLEKVTEFIKALMSFNEEIIREYRGQKWAQTPAQKGSIIGSNANKAKWLKFKDKAMTLELEPINENDEPSTKLFKNELNEKIQALQQELTQFIANLSNTPIDADGIYEKFQAIKSIAESIGHLTHMIKTLVDAQVACAEKAAIDFLSQKPSPTEYSAYIKMAIVFANNKEAFNAVNPAHLYPALDHVDHVITILGSSLVHKLTNNQVIAIYSTFSDNPKFLAAACDPKLFTQPRARLSHLCFSRQTGSQFQTGNPIFTTVLEKQRKAFPEDLKLQPSDHKGQDQNYTAADYLFFTKKLIIEKINPFKELGLNVDAKMVEADVDPLLENLLAKIQPDKEPDLAKKKQLEENRRKLYDYAAIAKILIRAQQVDVFLKAIASKDAKQLVATITMALTAEGLSEELVGPLLTLISQRIQPDNMSDPGMKKALEEARQLFRGSSDTAKLLSLIKKREAEAKAGATATAAAGTAAMATAAAGSEASSGPQNAAEKDQNAPAALKK